MAHITDQEIARSRSSAASLTMRKSFCRPGGGSAWGVFGYMKMPQRKDPDIQVRQCMIVTPAGS
jgi:hypothetical protein